MNKREVWVKGEEGAKRYLVNKGYKILASNYSTKVGEIDIIASDNGVIVFVEVKARTRTDFGEPIEAVTPMKVKKIVTVAKQYLLSRGLYDSAEVRFDVIECLADSFRHTINAFSMNDSAKYLR